MGREALTAVAQGFMTAFPDLEVFLDDLLIQDDRAIYCWTLTGTNSGPGGTGREVRLSGFEVWQIGADGLIANSRGYFDSAAYRRQLEFGTERPSLHFSPQAPAAAGGGRRGNKQIGQAASGPRRASGGSRLRSSRPRRR